MAARKTTKKTARQTKAGDEEAFGVEDLNLFWRVTKFLATLLEGADTPEKVARINGLILLKIMDETISGNHRARRQAK